MMYLITGAGITPGANARFLAKTSGFAHNILHLGVHSQGSEAIGS